MRCSPVKRRETVCGSPIAGAEPRKNELSFLSVSTPGHRASQPQAALAAGIGPAAAPTNTALGQRSRAIGVDMFVAAYTSAPNSLSRIPMPPVRPGSVRQRVGHVNALWLLKTQMASKSLQSGHRQVSFGRCAERRPLVALRRIRVVPDAEPIGCRDPCPPPSTRRAQALGQVTAIDERRPRTLGVALAHLGALERHADYRQAGHGHRLAPGRVPQVLDLA